MPYDRSSDEDESGTTTSNPHSPNQKTPSNITNGVTKAASVNETKVLPISKTESKSVKAVAPVEKSAWGGLNGISGNNSTASPKQNGKSTYISDISCEIDANGKEKWPALKRSPDQTFA